ncbi:NAD-dependent epimerase/dehydratase [Desulfovibrio sp. X2]|uniref:NAD-dependent epimerase/dehydratase family protein n=1 Tax=Desulfovibrio sp. X2 TaxID=941449 RepID=UPI000358AB0B|nr:NAD(P)-dependent oxidoreductase [Desulfovibrio sp. X2]EPR39804.1 NAD-dependent epimerase/dehydratase [Desulfovibrio sp. X2]
MKVTVFGGSGFLGSHVCDKLAAAGHEVTVFDRSASPWPVPGQRTIQGDILDETAVREAVSGAEAVFNFAGIADIGEANVLPVETVKANILGNTVVLEACRLENVRRFVYASTVYVYSASGGFYRCSKQASELFIETYHENFGLEYTILRYGSLYGPRADLRNAIYRFVRQAMDEGVIRYYGSPDALREYIHVEDAALASVEILKPEFANSRIVLTGHQAMRVGDVMKMIAEILGGGVRFEFFSEKGSAHYEITPYSFNPRMGRKYAPPLHMDLGQGVLRVVEEVHRELHPELENHDGVLLGRGED